MKAMKSGNGNNRSGEIAKIPDPWFTCGKSNARIEITTQKEAIDLRTILSAARTFFKEADLLLFDEDIQIELVMTRGKIQLRK